HFPYTTLFRSGRAGGLSGELQPRGLCADAHSRTETEFRVAPGNAGTSVRRRFPPARHRRALWSGGLAPGGLERRRPRRLSAEKMLEGAIDNFPAPLAPVRRGIPAAHADERPRSRATGLRVSSRV